MDLIDRQAAIKKILGQPPEPHYPSWYAEQIMQMRPAQKIEDLNKLIKALEEENKKLRERQKAQPEIIHCNDCQHSEFDALYGDRYCHHNGKAEIVPDDHYCGYAERRTNGQI